MIKIGIVDDHAIVRSGLRQFFSEHVDLRVVGEAANGREAIDLVRAQEIDVLVMDLSMPGQSGLDALAMLRAKAPDMGILILSGYPEEHYAINLIRQGASGYLNKECDPKEIVEAMNKDSGVELKTLKADGGMVFNELLMQFQADILNVPVVRPKVAETTCLGAAYAAGGQGVIPPDWIAQSWQVRTRSVFSTG